MPDTWFSGTTQYLYGNLSQPFQVTASRAPDNTLTVYYYDDFGALYALERGGARYYAGSDHLGTPKVITDNTGTIVRQMEYDSWGVKISDSGDTSFDLPVGFAGGIPDDSTGLVRFGFRDYEPGTGRWTAKDPIFFKSGQLNLYAYAQGDPVNFNDPSGLKDSSSASWGYYRVYKGIRMIAMPFYMGGIAGFFISPAGGLGTFVAFSGNIPIGIMEIKDGLKEIKENEETTSGGGSPGGTCPVRRQITMQP